jgi:hypothetical protein
VNGENVTTIPESMTPAFDYTGLDGQTVEDLHLAEEEYLHGKKLAARGLVNMGEGIAIAHDALVANCDRHKNQHSEDTFRAWCLSMGITKDTAYRLLQVSALMDGSSPAQQKVLKELSPSLLYAVAKPSAPEGLVEQVKNGDITTHKEYQELLAQLKAEKERSAAAEAREEEVWKMHEEAKQRADAAESQLEAVTADVQGLSEENARLTAEKEKAERGYNEMYESRIAANLQRQKAEAERDRAVQRAKTAEEALKKQPIAAVVDEEEMDRRAHQQAYAIAADMTGELRQKLERMQENDAAWVFQSKDRMESEWERMVPMLERMDTDIKKAALDGVLKMLGRIQGQAFALYPEEEEAGHEVPGAH